VLSGHGPTTTIGRERLTNPFLHWLPSYCREHSAEPAPIFKSKSPCQTLATR